MNLNQTFPASPKPSLMREGVVEVLLEWQKLGWSIYADSQPHRGEVFTIKIANNYRIEIYSEGNGVWTLACWGVGRRFGNASSIEELRARLSNHALNLGIPWPSSPSVSRLSKSTPAGNIGKIQRLIGHSQVEAVYDIYLDDKGLEVLLTLHNLGTKFSKNLRLLTSAAKIPKNLQKGFVSQVFIDLGCLEGKAKYIPDKTPGHEYRFMLLNDGNVLLLGTSLNRLECNEAVHRESDKNDRLVFENAWNSAIDL